MPDLPDLDLRLPAALTGLGAAAAAEIGEISQRRSLMVLDQPLATPPATRLLELLDATEELVIVTDPRGRVLYQNRAASLYVDLRHEGSIAGPLASLLTGVEHSAVWHTLESMGEWRGRRPAMRAEGTVAELDLLVRIERRETGEIASLVITATDVTEQQALSRALGHRATHDALTGLANRHHLLTLVDRVIRAKTLAARGVLAVIDIRSFRSVSNTLGHDAGDRVLRSFARRLAATFPGESVVARVGGDEFAVFCADRPGVGEVTADIDRVTASPFYVGDLEVHLSTVTGVASLGGDVRPSSAGELMAQADAALHRARQERSVRHRAFDPAVDAPSDLLGTERDLREALRREEIEVHYQPKISLVTGRIIGAEALVRWRTVDGSLRGPDSFLEVAEESGLIVPIGRVVFERACRMLVQARASGAAPDFQMAVNLSMRELHEPGLVEGLRDILVATGADPTGIEIEITESALIDDLDRVATTLRRIRELGATVGIDDFGTGYSSLQHVRDLPVDALKVDRSFVSALGTHEAAIPRTVIQLARSLRLDCVAEGVETEQQLAELRRMGCESAQGYFFSGPLPGPDFLRLLSAHPRW